MNKTTAKHSKRAHNGSAYDVYGDLIAIKNALADASYDVKGKATELLSESFTNIKEKSVDARDDVSAYVAKRPFKSLGVMFATGIALGYFLRRK